MEYLDFIPFSGELIRLTGKQILLTVQGGLVKTNNKIDMVKVDKQQKETTIILSNDVTIVLKDDSESSHWHEGKTLVYESGDTRIQIDYDVEPEPQNILFI